MDRQEARAVAAEKLEGLRRESYERLVETYLDKHCYEMATGPSGKTYHVDVEAFWDGGRHQPGDLRVLVSVDDRRWRGFVRPTCDSFIMREDGSFVGE